MRPVLATAHPACVDVCGPVGVILLLRDQGDNLIFPLDNSEFQGADYDDYAGTDPYYAYDDAYDYDYAYDYVDEVRKEAMRPVPRTPSAGSSSYRRACAH